MMKKKKTGQYRHRRQGGWHYMTVALNQRQRRRLKLLAARRNLKLSTCLRLMIDDEFLRARLQQKRVKV